MLRLRRFSLLNLSQSTKSPTALTTRIACNSAWKYADTENKFERYRNKRICQAYTYIYAYLFSFHFIFVMYAWKCILNYHENVQTQVYALDLRLKKKFHLHTVSNENSYRRILITVFVIRRVFFCILNSKCSLLPPPPLSLWWWMLSKFFFYLDNFNLK